MLYLVYKELLRIIEGKKMQNEIEENKKKFVLNMHKRFFM